jgi:hypothetical protein
MAPDGRPTVFKKSSERNFSTTNVVDAGASRLHILKNPVCYVTNIDQLHGVGSISWCNDWSVVLEFC